MPHKPGHFKPFTSFLNQGMKNTDNQASNINMPPNPINTPMNNNTLDTPQFPDSAIRPPVEQPKPSSILDNLTMNNKVTRNLMNPEQPGGGGQLFGESGGMKKLTLHLAGVAAMVLLQTQHGKIIGMIGLAI